MNAVKNILFINRYSPNGYLENYLVELWGEYGGVLMAPLTKAPIRPAKLPVRRSWPVSFAKFPLDQIMQCDLSVREAYELCYIRKQRLSDISYLLSVVPNEVTFTPKFVPVLPAYDSCVKHYIKHKG